MTKTPAKLRAGCVMTDMDSATIPCTAERTCLAVKRQVSSRGTRLQVKGPRPLDRRAVMWMGKEGGRERISSSSIVETEREVRLARPPDTTRRDGRRENRIRVGRDDRRSAAAPSRWRARAWEGRVHAGGFCPGTKRQHKY